MTSKELGKMNMEQLKGLLNCNYKAVAKTDKALADSIVYVGKKFKEDVKSVKKAELIELVSQTVKVLGDKFVSQQDKPKAKLAVAEASLKPKAKAEPKTEAEAPATEQKAPAKKAPASKTEAKKPEAESKNGGKTTGKLVSPKVAPRVVEFPNEIVSGDSTYVLAEDITDMKSLREAVGKDETIVFAFYWSKIDLKTTPYFGTLLGQPKQFENDIDLASAIYVSDEDKIAYLVSLYTEAVYSVLPEDFEVIDSVRYSGGSEFQIYRLVEATTE